MKTSTLLIVAMIVVSTSAVGFKNQVTEMMSSQAMAADAVDTVEKLLGELKDSIYEEQGKHDDRWGQQQTDGQTTIMELTAISQRNQEIAETATGHREWIETEMQDSDDHLNWIQTRLETIAHKLVQLNVTRCEANQLFIQQLKEHQDALDAISILRVELDRTQAAGQAPVFAQTEETFTNKLTEYEHLFEVNAMKEFFEAGDVIDEDDTEVNREILGRGQVVEDNDRQALDTEAFESTVDTSDLTGTLNDKVHAMLDRLQHHLQDGAKQLEINEIKAALDTANYQIKAASEVARLHIDEGKRHEYLQKMEVDLLVAQQVEGDAWELSAQSDRDVVDAKEDLQRLSDFYDLEKERRNTELAELEWVIDIFRDQVVSLGDNLRNRIDDYVHDERFDNMFSRKADKHVEAGVEAAFEN